MNIKYNVFTPDGMLFDSVNFSHKLSLLDIKRILVFEDNFPANIVIQKS